MCTHKYALVASPRHLPSVGPQTTKYRVNSHSRYHPPLLVSPWALWSVSWLWAYPFTMHKFQNYYPCEKLFPALELLYNCREG